MRRRGLSDRWKGVLRTMMPKAPFSLDQLAAASSADRAVLRAQVWNWKEVGYLTETADGRYDFTAEGIERLM